MISYQLGLNHKKSLGKNRKLKSGRSSLLEMCHEIVKSLKSYQKGDFPSIWGFGGQRDLRQHLFSTSESAGSDNIQIRIFGLGIPYKIQSKASLNYS